MLGTLLSQLLHDLRNIINNMNMEPFVISIYITFLYILPIRNAS